VGKWQKLNAAIRQPLPAGTMIVGALFRQHEESSKKAENMNANQSENKEQTQQKVEGKPSQHIIPHSHEAEIATGREERQEFYIPVQGFVWFYPEELEIIDHPAFQRLSGMHQLGLAYLVYRGATHRRFEHALGTVAIAQRMLDAVRLNCLKRGKKSDPKDEWILGSEPTEAEVRFTRLAALLHDIGHVPFGHTFEDELHLIGKHDKQPRLSMVLTKTAWHGQEGLGIEPLGNRIDRLYKKYLPEQLAQQKPSDVLKRIVIREPGVTVSEDAKGFAEAGLRLDVCADIVGNTICADLLDYLHRDWYHLGKPRHFDERLLHYMEIRTLKKNAGLSPTAAPKLSADDAFVISIGNRPKLRTDGISAILDLLENRYQLAEAVLFHRTKMSATSMLERALSLSVPLASPQQKNGEAAGSQGDKSELEAWLLDNAEERLLPALLDGNGLIKKQILTPGQETHLQQARKLASRLLRRDLYDVLLMMTFDEFEPRDVEHIQKIYGNGPDASVKRAGALGLLEDDFGLPHGSVTVYCPESRMNSKIAEVRLFLEGDVVRFDEHEKSKRKRSLSAGHLDAQLDRFQSLWKIGFFIDPEIKRQKGEEFISELRKAVRVLVLGLHDREDRIEMAIARIAREVVVIKGFHLNGKQALPEPKALLAARGDPSIAEQTYPLGARTLKSFIADGNTGNNP